MNIEDILLESDFNWEFMCIMLVFNSYIHNVLKVAR